MLLKFLLLTTACSCILGQNSNNALNSTSNSDKHELNPRFDINRGWFNRYHRGHVPDVFRRMRQDFRSRNQPMNIQLAENSATQVPVIENSVINSTNLDEFNKISRLGNQPSPMQVPERIVNDEEQRGRFFSPFNKNGRRLLSNSALNFHDHRLSGPTANNEVHFSAGVSNSDSEDDLPLVNESNPTGQLKPSNVDDLDIDRLEHFPNIMNNHLSLRKPPFFYPPGLSDKRGLELTFGNQRSQDTVLRTVNRPPDIIIRNTFLDKPKSWIDLRITIDQNGVLNIEAGPQGVSTQTETTDVGTSRNSQQPSSAAEDNDNHESLEDHWNRNRLMHLVQKVSGTWDMHPFTPHFHQHIIRDKRMPFWFLQKREGAHQFGHGPIPFGSKTNKENNYEVIGHVSQVSTNEQKETSSNNLPIIIHGPSIPPHVPSKMTVQQNERNEEAKFSSKSSKRNEATKLGAGNEDNKSLVQQVSLLSESKVQEDPSNQMELSQQEETLVNIDDSSVSGCPKLKCGTSCSGGLTKLDLSSGCPTCECCPNIVCRRSCSDGYGSDKYGCPTCRCSN